MAGARVPLNGPAVRFDYTSIDPTTHTLWISQMDASQLLAFEVVHRKITKTIAAPACMGSSPSRNSAVLCLRDQRA